jgi:hypothetical protein
MLSGMMRIRRQKASSVPGSNHCQGRVPLRRPDEATGGLAKGGTAGVTAPRTAQVCAEVSTTRSISTGDFPQPR